MHLTEEERKMLNHLREKGFAVVVFGPEELKKTPRKHLEEVLVAYGNEMLTHTHRRKGA